MALHFISGISPYVWASPIVKHEANVIMRFMRFVRSRGLWGGFLCLLLKREKDFTPISRHNFPPTLKEILEMFMDVWCPPNRLRKLIQALYMRGEG
jgi:hypothetical protein